MGMLILIRFILSIIKMHLNPLIIWKSYLLPHILNYFLLIVSFIAIEALKSLKLYFWVHPNTFLQNLMLLVIFNGTSLPAKIDTSFSVLK